MRATQLIIVATIITLPAGPLAAQPFTQVWVFGDSTVDTGWYEKSPYSGEPHFDSYFPNSAADNFGAPTTNPGPVSVQTLGDTFGLTVIPQNQGGTDYATGGARNNETNASGSGFFPNAVPTIQQIGNYLQAATPDGHALYLISSGGNDVSFAVKQVTSGQYTNAKGRAYVKNAANLLGAEIKTLQSGGAKYIIVANQPKDFGSATDNTKPYRQLYNTTLRKKLNNEHVHYAWADVNGVRHAIINDPTDFKITNFDNATPSCTTPATSTGIKSSWAFVCSPNSPVSTPTASDPNLTLFADNEHWASGAQTVLGSYYFCLAKHKWSGRFNGYTKAPPFACSLFGL